jgi:alkylated DNA repair protein alkB family protein 1
MENAYKSVHNKHRRRPNEPGYIGDLNDLIDFSTKFSQDERIIRLDTTPIKNRVNEEMHSCFEGPVFGLKTHSGFLYAPQAISEDLQKYLAYKAVTEFCQSPNVTNIDLIPIKDDETNNNTEDTIWSLWKKENRLNTHDNPVIHNSSKRSRTESKSKARFYRCMDKLSWATSGYHYDWTARAYREDRKSEVPTIMKYLGSYFSQLDDINNKNGHIPNNKDAEKKGFRVEATIVNYYSLKSIMGGHKDDLELDHSQPVISISIGLPAVFLLGGDSKNGEFSFCILHTVTRDEISNIL